MTIYVNLIKNLKLSNLNGNYDHYYLCFENGYEHIQQPLNELEWKECLEFEDYDNNIIKTINKKLNEYNVFVKSCVLQKDNNIITLTCEKIYDGKKSFDFLKNDILTRIRNY